MDISQYLRQVARGKNGAEHLERETAARVLEALLADDADALQLGAFLIAERMKGESSQELAGFVDAARRHIAAYGEHVAPAGAVDLPCYAGKRRAAPLYLAAAIEAREAGTPLLVHGMAQIAGRITAWQALQQAGVRRASTLAEALQIMRGEGIAYIDLAELCPPLLRLLMLRPRLGVRSFANSVARLLNPLACDGQLNGVFHTPYVALMARANIMLGQGRSLLFMGAEGEPELYAERQKLVTAQQGDALQPLGFADLPGNPYPRQPEPRVDALLVHFSRLLRGEMDAREQGAMRRMREAFAFAASGTLPAGWERRLQQHDNTEVEDG